MQEWQCPIHEMNQKLQKKLPWMKKTYFGLVLESVPTRSFLGGNKYDHDHSIENQH